MTKEEAAELILRGRPTVELPAIVIILDHSPSIGEIRTAEGVLKRWSRYLEARDFLGLPKPKVDYEALELYIAESRLIEHKKKLKEQR